MSGRVGVVSAWVAIQCHFRCASCRQRSPLNHLDFDGDVECLRCGQTERFDLGQWVDALAFAARVSENQDQTTVETHGSDAIRSHAIVKKTLVTRAHSGVPSCPGCDAPLGVERVQAGLLVAMCSACDWRGKFVLPRGVRQIEPRLAGAIAAAHAKDARPATLEGTDAGAAVVKCPYCTAPIDHEATATIARCKYCRVTVRLPSKRLVALGHELEPELWWLYFSA